MSNMDNSNTGEVNLYDALMKAIEEISRKPTLVDKDGIPLCEKVHLTVEEACKYYNIGQNKMRDMINDRRCDFVLCIGTKKLIKRKKLDEYLENATVI